MIVYLRYEGVGPSCIYLPYEVAMRRLVLMLVVLFSVSALRAQETPQKIATVEGVTEYRLANGARVLLFPEASRPS